MQPPTVTTKRGADILHDPLFNKGTAFRMNERDRLGLRGMVPPRRLQMSSQLDKVLSNFRAIRDPLQQNVFLCDLLDRNGTQTLL